MTRRHRAALATALALTALAGMGLTGMGLAPPTMTDAAFTDAERVTGGAVTAYTVPPPQPSEITVCARPALLNLSGKPVLAVTWSWPPPAPPAGTLSSEWKLSGTLLAQSATTGSGPYTTTVSNGLLSSLLGGLTTLLAGGSYQLHGTTTLTTASGSWTSLQKTVITVTVPAGFGDPTCTVSTAPV